MCVSGFDKAGKTAVTLEMLKQSTSARRAVVSSNPQAYGASPEVSSKAFFKRPDGVVCYNAQPDIFRQLRNIIKQTELDEIIWDTDTHVDPLFVTIGVFQGDEDEDDENPLSEFIDIQSFVTVVDASAILDDYQSENFIQEEFEDEDEDGEGEGRAVPNLIAEQIEYSNIIVLNKLNGVSQDKKTQVLTLIKALNKGATIIEANSDRFPIYAAIEKAVFDEEESTFYPRWTQELQQDLEETTSSNDGVDVFIFQAKEPLDPKKFNDFLSKPQKGLIRAQGFFWLATRPDLMGELNICGSAVSTDAIDRWWSSIPKKEWPQDPDELYDLMEAWDDKYHDRCQQIVFIGDALDKDFLEKQLKGCLIIDEDAIFQAKKYASLTDPFPEWLD